MAGRGLRTFDLSVRDYAGLTFGLLLLAVLGAFAAGALGGNPLMGAILASCGVLLVLTVVDRARWGGRRSQHLVTFAGRPASEGELREICAELGRRGIAADVERDAEGRAVLGYQNADQRGIVPVLVSRGASAPRSGW